MACVARAAQGWTSAQVLLLQGAFQDGPKQSSLVRVTSLPGPPKFLDLGATLGDPRGAQGSGEHGVETADACIEGRGLRPTRCGAVLCLCPDPGSAASSELLCLSEPQIFLHKIGRGREVTPASNGTMSVPGA